MGALAGREVFRDPRFPHLSDNAQDVWLHMAFTSWDPPAPPGADFGPLQYFAGWESLALNIKGSTGKQRRRYDVPPLSAVCGTPEGQLAEKARRAAYRAVDRALSELKKAKAIEVDRKPWHGRPARYNLLGLNVSAPDA